METDFRKMVLTITANTVRKFDYCCPNCYETRLIGLNKYRDLFDNKWFCFECDNFFTLDQIEKFYWNQFRFDLNPIQN